MRPGLSDPSLAAAVAEAEREWAASRGTERLLARDASLWTGADEARWLGWLDPAEAASGMPQWLALAEAARREGLTHALVLGMGGSSLFPLVLARTFGARPGWPALRVLDSTDPAEVLAAERAADLSRTLVLVASKSGSTLEPTLFMERLLSSVAGALGSAEAAAARFIAITDPGSSLEAFASARGFRAIVAGVPGIGGRFSALSAFGMLPGAVAGAPVDDLLASARAMAAACASCRVQENPGARLGLALGALARAGRDKVTLVPSSGLAAIGAWIEQLVAESTGKNGRGLVPIDGERLAAPDRYGSDRVFVSMRLATDAGGPGDDALRALEAAGHPVLHLDAARPADLGGLVVAWEFATAVAGSILGVHPFDQPDVEAAKIATRELMAAAERTGQIPRETALCSAGPLRVEAGAASAEALSSAANAALPDSVDAVLARHLARLAPGDYFALLAFIPQTQATRDALDRMRHAVRDAARVATSVGFGPRFLHSTGQLHAGGPASGVFLQVTCEDPEDCPIPGRAQGLAMVKAAQAGGNLRVLEARGRRALRVHVSGDLAAGMDALARSVERAMKERR